MNKTTMKREYSTPLTTVFSIKTTAQLLTSSIQERFIDAGTITEGELD